MLPGAGAWDLCRLRPACCPTAAPAGPQPWDAARLVLRGAAADAETGMVEAEGIGQLCEDLEVDPADIVMVCCWRGGGPPRAG